MSWGNLKIGRIALRETYAVTDQVNASSGERTLTIRGTETYPGISYAELHARREDLMGIRGELVGVSFSAKSAFDGFYEVRDLGAIVRDWKATEEAAGLDWNATLSLIGPANAVDIESRLTGIARLNDFSVVGERWHAPAAGALGYFTGATNPSSSVDRIAEDGSVLRVRRGLPSGIDPRWSVSSVAAYLAGRVRFLAGGIERYGVRVNVLPTGWEVINGLVRVRLSATASATLDVDAWDGSWQVKAWDIAVSGDVITPAEILGVTVIRNDNEMVSLRLFSVDAAFGRTYLDLSLRRGSRFVECYLQVPAAATLKAQLHTLEASTKTSGYVAANANDGDGNKSWSCSAKSFTLATNGGVEKAATTTLDFAIGVVLNGTGAVAGDAAAVLYDQYIGALPESTTGVLR